MAIGALLSVGLVQGQVCDNSIAPTNLTTSLDPASGLRLEWDAVPGSVGILVLVVDPAGTSFQRRYVGSDLDALVVPEARLMPGTYTWTIQATCSTVFPYALTPVSASATYTYAPASGCPNSVADVDGNVYGVAEINGRCWTTEHLRTRHYKDGSPIEDGTNTTASDWGDFSQLLGQGAYCYPSGDSLNEALYGLLYNADAPNDARGICPMGWHVPSLGEYSDLVNGLGGTGVAFDALANSPSDSPPWQGTNASGFSGQPAGLRSTGGGFGSLGNEAWIWTSTPGTFTTATGTILLWEPGSSGDVLLFPGGIQDRGGHSVRCVKD